MENRIAYRFARELMEFHGNVIILSAAVNFEINRRILFKLKPRDILHKIQTRYRKGVGTLNGKYFSYVHKYTLRSRNSS